ncbi:indolepyruvate oxidoreductase subunit beta [Caproiciproducens galactitolivorans]|uniref:NADH-dependent phenylglyoxylate dehydrogenase subunit gamma n=1 Tax=Caproiciproducens galactitolivorans TaxID=642589 RepID=A0A4Z0YE46_9FIRM|nr:indolepyruvate oxidoreductase subunit beta [Caproiciproducens galactitolivorans]QEY35748.1 indolepyruvate oxidoreductase subunit beta [Caproiciproducens galactitolivorans]TGJ77481.1 NADH-dependent phenylglyoxylate dehydrogenase subunit gamma [Caproiciproducens galactitolivorans]
MSQVKSVMIVGVGGQGTLLASRVLGSAMLHCGADVKVSEVHGMSQRGGSVVTYVRYGDKVYSPVIDKGEADVLMAFEALEAARFLPWLKTDGTIVVNTQQIDPMPVVTGSAAYPENIIGSVKAEGAKVVAFDALKLAEQAGSVRAVNIVLIGAVAKRLSIDKQVWIDTIKETVPAKFMDMNLKAFELGYNAQEI